MYGKNGFLQYQLILPEAESFEGISELLEIIAASGKGSFLAVLKLYGEENSNYLSFPMRGYSLALDFKIQDGVFELLDELDKIVAKSGGRVYLAKDARLSKKHFDAGYPRAEIFREFRKNNNLKATFQSLQSKRLEI